MRKNVFNLVIILLILNSIYNILNEMLIPLCPIKGGYTKPRCRKFFLVSDKIKDEEENYPELHKDNDKFYKNIYNMYIPTLIFYFLCVILAISYFFVPKNLKNKFAYAVVIAMIISCSYNIFLRATRPPMCPLDKKNDKPKCVSYDMYSNYVDLWGLPLRHEDNIKFHRGNEGLRLPELVGYSLILCLSIFTLIKK